MHGNYTQTSTQEYSQKNTQTYKQQMYTKSTKKTNAQTYAQQIYTNIYTLLYTKNTHIHINNKCTQHLYTTNIQKHNIYTQKSTQ